MRVRVCVCVCERARARLCVTVTRPICTPVPVSLAVRLAETLVWLLCRQAMVMAAQDGDKVELLKPPPGVPVGERVTFGDGPLKGDAATPNQLNKGAGKKAVEFIIGGTGLKT